MEILIPILVAFVLPITIVGMAMSHKQKMAALKQPPAQDESLKQELAAIKERLNALEAIVTDDKYQLSREIDKLKNAIE
jgi:Tfp pilus assembly protein PilO